MAPALTIVIFGYTVYVVLVYMSIRHQIDEVVPFPYGILLPDVRVNIRSNVYIHSTLSLLSLFMFL